MASGMSCCKQAEPSANQGQMEPMQPQPPLPTITQAAASHTPLTTPRPQPRVVQLPPLLLHQKALKYLAMVQLVFAILSLVIDVGCVIFAESGYLSSYTSLGISGSIFSGLAACIGIIALQAPGNQTLMVTYFTMGLLVSIFWALLEIVCSITWTLLDIQGSDHPTARSLNIFLIYMSLANMTVFIISLCFICYNWISNCHIRLANVLKKAITLRQPVAGQLQQHTQHQNQNDPLSNVSQVSTSSPRLEMPIVQPQPPPAYGKQH